MNILLTNDDGIEAPGIRALAEVLAELGEVTVVAPKGQCSATGHSINLFRPMKIEERKPGWYAVHGMPTDCVQFGVKGLFGKERPDLLVSGINQGPNLADDITYSGTVSAALEGVLLGVPSFAISLADYLAEDYYPAARVARRVAEEMVFRGFPPRTYLNVNVPPGVNGQAPLSLTRLGQRIYSAEIQLETTEDGHRTFCIDGGKISHVDIEGSDCNAVAEGRISVTPLGLDNTEYGLMEDLLQWDMIRASSCEKS